MKWSDKWQMLFNFGKCKCLHTGPGNTTMNYEMGGTLRSKTGKEKDLGVTMNENLYSSLIESHLQYCTLLWANSHMRKLQLLQKKTIRIITSSHYIAHTDPLFAMTKHMKLEDMYKYQLGILMQRVTHSQPQLPHNMSSMFLRTDKIHSHKLRNQNAYFIQQIRTNTRKSTINFSGPTYWNTLPVNLRQIVSIHLFKKKFKELLQSRYP